MDTALVSLFVNAGLAGVVVILLITGILITGREYERVLRALEKSEDALALERQRNADLLVWASTGTRALQAVARVAEEAAPQQRAGSPAEAS